jgi:hypothetical protein
MSKKFTPTGENPEYDTLLAKAKPKNRPKSKVILCEEYDLTLNDGTRYKINCGSEEFDKLIELIGENNIIWAD